MYPSKLIISCDERYYPHFQRQQRALFLSSAVCSSLPLWNGVRTSKFFVVYKMKEFPTLFWLEGTKEVSLIKIYKKIGVVVVIFSTIKSLQGKDYIYELAGREI